MTRCLSLLVAVFFASSLSFSLRDGPYSPPSLRHARPTAGAEAAATGRIALTIANRLFCLCCCRAVPIQTMAITCAGIVAGLCADYAMAMFLVGHAGRLALTWILFLGSMLLAWRLLWKIAPSAATADAARTRPLGIKFLAGLAAASLLLAPTLIRSDFRHHAPRWQIASHIFNFTLCAVLSFGLWNLREWARILTEVTSFLAPLNVLPSFLGTSKHKPFVIAISISALMYAAWSIWYLRQDAIVQRFDAGDEPCSST